ncbi:MAG: oxygen-independent coproporphyrinogen III oxidase [Candidatus Sericytochromatia bacterium]
MVSTEASSGTQLEDYQVPRELLSKYAKPGPRYTSYPTAPEWADDFTQADAEALYRANNPEGSTAPLALYVHIPFCTSLCWYCGCNVQISRKKQVSEPYLKALEQELDKIAPLIAKTRTISQMHWGGGTPTYLEPEQIERLVAMIRQRIDFAPGAEISIEVDPRVTTDEHVLALRRAGFNRLSMGIQDFNPQVQQAVHRVQSFEQTQHLVNFAREQGFASINMDLMYGLPHQTVASFEQTLEQVFSLSPDRLALFHYAHVPWLKPAQKLLKEETLPDSDTKLAIFELAIASFLERGYVYIGMDHFAKPEDELALAQKEHSLRRNFMGYTTQAGVDLYGLGVSSISEIDGHFIQNLREVPAYEGALAEGHLPTHRGLLLSADDHLRKAIIENLICNGYLDFTQISRQFQVDFPQLFHSELENCKEMAEDGLIELTDGHIAVLPRGQILIRNVCMVWDAYLGKRSGQQMFSRTA